MSTFVYVSQQRTFNLFQIKRVNKLDLYDIIYKTLNEEGGLLFSTYR